MKYILMVATLMVAFFTNAALADQVSSPVVVPSISKLPDKGNVAISGVIEKAKGSDEFVLGDGSGTVDVKIATGSAVVFKEGDKVSVVGNVDNGFFGLLGKTIDANYVQVQKNVSSSISDAITSATGVSVEQARTAQIAQLPAQGIVKVTGTVDNVVSSKDFILKDTTGTIDVSIQSDENVALTKNASVTVVGYVGNSALGDRNIRATHVIVANNTPSGDTSQVNPQSM